MNKDLSFSCAEFREISESNPNEIEVIMEMMIEADEELCHEED